MTDNGREARVVFLQRLEQRLEKGAETFGDRSLAAPPITTLGEMLEEVVDIAGWAFVLHENLKRRAMRVIVADRVEVSVLRERLELASRAIRGLLEARGTGTEGFSTTLLKDADGYFEVRCDRGIVRVIASEGGPVSPKTNPAAGEPSGEGR